MPLWKELDDHINVIFEKYNSGNKNLKILPVKTGLNNLKNNILYKVSFVSIAVDVVNFKLLNEYSNAHALNVIMNEFFYGITKIMKSESILPSRIDIQGDGIYAIYRIETKNDIDFTFKILAFLNTFQNHIKKKIRNHFPGLIKKNRYSDSDFLFGIGASFSFDNYISLVGYKADQDLIFMGHSVNCSNELAKKANRENCKPIMFDALFYNNFSDESKKRLAKINGINKKHLNSTYTENIYECNFIISPYENFIKNNVK